MYLSNIKLWNFRKYGTEDEYVDKVDTPDLDLTLNNGLNVFIGSNDSGKTAIIDAIKLVLKTHSYEFIRPSREDFHGETKRFRIELIFKDFNNPFEAANFLEWLGHDNEGNLFLKIIFDVFRDDSRIFPSDIKSGADDEGTSLTAEAKELLNVTYLKPLRDAANELVAKKGSRISQILMGDEAFKGKESSHDLITIFSDFNESIEKYFEGVDRSGTALSDLLGKDLKEKIDDYIHSFYDSSKESSFSVYEGKLRQILEKISLAIKDEMNLGLGTLNRLFMASELIHLNRVSYHGLNLALIEELEAHLHPQAQMQVIEKLQTEVDKQLILTTHSPNLASKVKLENLIICNQDKAYPMGSTYTKLAKGDYYFLERFLDTTKADLFFAKGVLLVEGAAENILLPTIAKLLDKNLTDYGVSIINVGGVAFLRYANIFLRKENPQMDIKVSLITDVDVQPIECNPKMKDTNGTERSMTDPEVETKRTETITTKESKYDEPIKSFIAPYWTLEYTIALSCLSKLFHQAVYICWKSKNRDYVYTDEEKALYINEADTEYDAWSESEDKSIEEIAFEIYNNILLKKNLSKAVVAQVFTQILEEADLTLYDIKNDDKLQYLVDAINYAIGD